MTKPRLIDPLTNMYVTGRHTNIMSLSPVFDTPEAIDAYTKILRDEYANITIPVFRPQDVKGEFHSY